MATETVCKFKVESVTQRRWHQDREVSEEKIVFTTVYDPSIREDRNFAEATPMGTIEISVTNPAIIGKIRPGESYYVRFEPAETE